MEEGNRDPERCPYHLRLLRNLYGTLLRSLQEVVQDLGDGEEMGLVRDDDSVEYLILLKRSFALLPDGALERVGRGEAMNQRWSQQQASIHHQSLADYMYIVFEGGILHISTVGY